MAAARGAAPFAVRRRPPRSRRALVLRWIVGVATVALLAAGGWWLTATDVLAVRRVETGAYRFTARMELERRLADLLDRNILLLDNDEVQGALAGLPWVRGARVERRLPGTLVVDLAEWRPLLAVAGAADDAGLQVLVRDGRVLPFPDHLAPPALPVLVGAVVARDEAGTRRLGTSQLAPLLALLGAVEATGLEALCAVDFLVVRDDGFAIVLQDGRGTLLLGREDFRARLDRYLVAHDHLAEGLEVDLRFRDRITVRRPDA